MSECARRIQARDKATIAELRAEVARLRAGWYEVLKLADMAADRVPVISRKLAELVERATTSALPPDDGHGSGRT